MRYWRRGRERGEGGRHLRQRAYPSIDKDRMAETPQVENMLDTGVETLFAHVADGLVHPPRRRQHPHQVRPVDHTATGQVPLTQKPGLLVRGRLRVEGELERRGQELSPFLELVVELGDHVWEASVVEADARVLAVEEMVHAVQESADRETREEIQRRTLFLADVVVCMAVAWERDRGLHVGYAGEWEG